MRFNQIVETTTAGSVATVAQPMMTQTRENVNVPGLKPVQQLMKGKSKKKGPYANSINEGKVKQLTMDLKELTDEEFKKKYNKTKVEIKADMKKVNEDDLAEQDLIVIPGQGRLRRTGFVKQDLDQGEHEGHTLKNSLHTIARAASDLDKRLSTQSEFPEWVSEKIGAAKGMMVTVMDYLISSQEMQQEPDAMNEDMNNTAYTPQVGEEILWRSRNSMNKMMPVPGTVLAIAPGKVTIKIKSPRLIQNIGKDTIVLNLSDYVLMPKQGVAEADTGSIDPATKCKTCGTSYKNHFRFDDNGKIISTLVRHMTMKDDFPGMSGLDTSIFTPTNKPGQVAKKPMTPFKTQGVAEGWKDEANDYKEWSNHVKNELLSVAPSQQYSMALRLSQIERKHFGSEIETGFNTQTGRPDSTSNKGLTGTVSQIFRAIKDGSLGAAAPAAGTQSTAFGTVTRPADQPASYNASPALAGGDSQAALNSLKGDSNYPAATTLSGPSSGTIKILRTEEEWEEALNNQD